jgi:hypothetical protein
MKPPGAAPTGPKRPKTRVILSQNAIVRQPRRQPGAAAPSIGFCGTALRLTFPILILLMAKKNSPAAQKVIDKPLSKMIDKFVY